MKRIYLNSSHLVVFNCTFGEVWNYTFTFPTPNSFMWPDPVIEDVDGNSILDIIVAGRVADLEIFRKRSRKILRSVDSKSNRSNWNCILSMASRDNRASCSLKSVGSTTL